METASRRKVARVCHFTGQVEVHLWIASDCPDTDFTAKLIDVVPPNEDYPDGFAMNLTERYLVCFLNQWMLFKRH